MGTLALAPATAGTIGIVFSLVSLVSTVIWLLLIAYQLWLLARAVPVAYAHYA